MKTIIDLGIALLLLGMMTKNLPTILRNVRKGQIILLKEASASKWGKGWVPDSK